MSADGSGEDGRGSRLRAALAKCVFEFVNHEESREGIFRGLVDVRDELFNFQTQATRKRRSTVKSYQVRYDYKSGRAYGAIVGKFGSGLPVAVLRAIVISIGEESNLKVERATKRRKDLLFAWLDSHYESLVAFLPRASLLDDRGSPIGSS